MRKEYLAIEEATVVAGVRIIPVVRISVRYTQIRGARSFSAGKQPVYLVITSPEGQRAYGIMGGDVAIQQVISDCPALAAALEGRPDLPLLPH